MIIQYYMMNSPVLAYFYIVMFGLKITLESNFVPICPFPCKTTLPHTLTYTNSKYIIEKKLIKPYIAPEYKVGISSVKEVINNNYFLHKKWTMIRDIHSYCLNNFLGFRSTIIDMDTVDESSSGYIKSVIKNGTKNGLWITFSFKKKV